MTLEDCGTDDMIDELEDRGYIIIDKEEYESVLDQFKQWKNGGKA